MPVEYQCDYYNRKGWYSIVIQAVVDHRYLIKDVCIGWPGSVHDATIFVNSQSYNKITQEDTLKEAASRTILNADIPVHLIGDIAYPMYVWLLKPFNDNPNLSPQQKYFNYRLSRPHIVVKNAFEQLKG